MPVALRLADGVPARVLLPSGVPAAGVGGRHWNARYGFIHSDGTYDAVKVPVGTGLEILTYHEPSGDRELRVLLSGERGPARV